MTTPAPAHPWRRTARTVFAAVVAAAALAPVVYSAAVEREPDQATGYAALGLALCAAITRVMALPGVEAFLRRFLPFLAAQDVDAGSALVLAPAGRHRRPVAGDASSLPTGTELDPSTRVRDLGAGELRMIALVAAGVLAAWLVILLVRAVTTL